MSVINKMLQDLDKRGAAQGRADGPSRPAGIAVQPASRVGRWKIAAWALVVPLVLAAGWVVLRPGSGSSDKPAKAPQNAPLAAVTPRPTEMQAKADVVAQAPTPQAPAVTVAPPAPVAEPKAPAAGTQAQATAATPAAPVAKPAAPAPQAPSVSAAPPAPPAKPQPSVPAVQPAPAVAVAPVAPAMKPPASAPSPQVQGPAVAAVPAAPVAKPPAAAPSLVPALAAAPPKPPAVAAAPPKAPAIVAAPAKAPVVAATPPKAPAAAAAPPKAPVVIAQADVPSKPASKSEAPAREVKPERKPTERTDSAISTSKKSPATPPAAKPEKTVSKAPTPATDGKPSAPLPAANAGRAPAPALDTTKSSISVERQDRDASRLDRVAAEYRNAIDLMNQGRAEPAIDAFAGVLRVDPKHAAARQALVALLIGRGRTAEAQGVLREGLAALPENTAWAMLLARLQVEGGDRTGALATLDAALPYAKNRPDYHAFVGTVLQLQGRHKDAIAYYEIAVRLSPGSGPWLIGLAISLEEEKRLPEAREAYQRALATSALAPDLRAFVERKLAQLK